MKWNEISAFAVKFERLSLQLEMSVRAWLKLIVLVSEKLPVVDCFSEIGTGAAVRRDSATS